MRPGARDGDLPYYREEPHEGMTASHTTFFSNISEAAIGTMNSHVGSNNDMVMRQESVRQTVMVVIYDNLTWRIFVTVF